VTVDTGKLDRQIIEQGRRFFALMEKHTPSIFSTERWVRRLMDWTMGRDRLKAEVFTLVDCLPELTTEKMLYNHIRQSFTHPEVLPLGLRLGLRIAGLLGPLGRKIVTAIVSKCIRTVAHQFIIAGKVDQTIAKLRNLREKDGFAFTLDVLGEDTVTEQQVEQYVEKYFQLLAGMKTAQQNWPPLAHRDSLLDWGSAPKINISVKPSALDSHPDPDNLQATVSRMLERLSPLYRIVVQLGGFLCIDIETRKLREITFELYRRLRSDPEFRHYPHLGLAMQVYFKDTDAELDKMLTWARGENLPISIRLVKGAYWEYEVAAAEKDRAPVPVYTIKAETDLAFERAAQTILKNHDICHLACASHNIRSVCSVLALTRALNVPEEHSEFQVLYGMAESFRKALLGIASRVRLYCPQGQLITAMAYLVRRLIENTSSESFMHLTFAEHTDKDRLLENPAITLDRIHTQQLQ
jgi:RHH-type proline utilization regulon transcriptional repressor/proline dehydrogenase/delta 1-pyrroline-5-carboxylate dehydrogenase